jgi:hypothetical protein
VEATVADEYENNRRAIYGYAGDVWAEVGHWNDSAYRVKAAKIDATAFTGSGGKIAAAYGDLVDDYSWSAWRIAITLHKVMNALDQTAQNYGKAEAKSKDDINSVGEQF